MSLLACFRPFTGLVMLGCFSLPCVIAADSTIPTTEMSSFRPYDFPATPSMRDAAITVKATGFFRVEQIKGRWWLIDPLGRADLFIGINGGAGLRWNDDFSKSLLKHYSSEVGMRDGITPVITGAGFNVSGGDGGESYRLMVNDGCRAGSSGRLMPHASLLDLNDASARHGADAEAVNIYPQPYKPGGEENWHQWVADPFHPSFAAGVERYAERLCAPNKGNPWMVGYFLDNERAWQTTEAVLAAVMRKPATQPAKQKLVALARERFADVAAFNRAFLGTDYSDIGELAQATSAPLAITDAGRALYDAWGEAFYDTWFATAARIVRKHDPDHLILGTREMGCWNGDDRHLYGALGRHCDVISVNEYVPFDWQAQVPGVQVARWKRTVALAGGKPMIVSEYGIQSHADSKMLSSLYVPTQAERGPAHRIFFDAIAAQPFMLGAMWFQLYNDSPQNFGILDDAWKPYRPLVDDLAANHARAGKVRLGTLAKPVRGAIDDESWTPKLPAAAAVVPGTGLDENVGQLRCTLEGGALRLRRGERVVGRFQPWVHQQVPSNRWPETTTAVLLARRQDAAWTVADIRFARPAGDTQGVDAGDGKAPPPGQRPFAAFSVTYRLWFPRSGDGWFLSQHLEVASEDAQALRCVGVFQILHPVGNNKSLTMPQSRSPHETAWVDRTAGLALLTAAPTIGSRFMAGSWFNADGSPHPNAVEPLDDILTPGAVLKRTGIPVLHACFTPGSDGEIYPGVTALYAEVRTAMGMKPW